MSQKAVKDDDEGLVADLFLQLDVRRRQDTPSLQRNKNSTGVSRFLRALISTSRGNMECGCCFPLS